MPATWSALLLSSLLSPFRPASFLRRLSNRLSLPTRRHAADPPPPAAHAAPVQPPTPTHPAPTPSHPSSTHRTAPTAPQNPPKPTLPAPRRKPASSLIALRETVETCPRRDPSVKFIRAPRLAAPPSPQRTPKTSQKSAPNYLKSFLEETLIAREAPASTPQPAAQPTSPCTHPRQARARQAPPPSAASSLARWERVGVRVFRATRPASAPSPQPAPQTRQNSAPPPLKSFLEETLPAHETSHSHPASRHPVTSHPRSFGSSSLARWQRLGVSLSRPPHSASPPSPQPLPVPPPSAPDLTALPSALAPSSLPPHLKSFLEKTLTRAKPPHFAPPTIHPSSVPNAPHPTPMTGDNQIADPLPGRIR